MVLSRATLSLPKTNTINCLLGTAQVPIRSTKTDYKAISLDCPVGFQLKFANYQAQGQTITITINPASSCSVYLNGYFFATSIILPSENDQYGYISKSYVMSNSSSQVYFEINEFFTTLSTSYFPPQDNTLSTDVYTFYMNITYTITSTSSQIYYVDTTLTCGCLLNTTQSTPYLANFSYNSGTSASSSYVSTRMYQQINTPQPPTWFISSKSAGNSYTPSTYNLGSSFTVGSGKWDKITVYGNAQTSNWNPIYGYFTATISGIYCFQLCIFNNGTSTTGRWLQAKGTCILGTTQYLTFNQSFLTGDSGSFTFNLTYYMGVGQTLLFYCADQSPTLYYGDGHTTLQIIKVS